MPRLEHKILARCNHCNRLFSLRLDVASFDIRLSCHWCESEIFLPTGSPLVDAVLFLTDDIKPVDIIDDGRFFAIVNHYNDVGPHSYKTWKIQGSAYRWIVYHKSITDSSYPSYLRSHSRQMNSVDLQRGPFGHERLSRWDALEWLLSKEGQVWQKG
jgi:hypothetical protein